MFAITVYSEKLWTRLGIRVVLQKRRRNNIRRSRRWERVLEGLSLQKRRGKVTILLLNEEWVVRAFKEYSQYPDDVMVEERY